MKNIDQQYSKFDRAMGGQWFFGLGITHYDNCEDCYRQYCGFNFCKVYDADGDPIKPIYPTGSGAPYYPHYVKADANGNPTDVLAKEPFNSNASCCYKATINGVVSNGPAESWCADCENVNGIYYSNFLSYSDGYGDMLGYEGDQDVNNLLYYNSKFQFSLCDLEDFIDIEGSGTYPKSVYPPCQLTMLLGGTYLKASTEASGNPDIRAQAVLVAFNWDFQSYTRRPEGIFDYRIARVWEKSIGTYTGNYYLSSGAAWPSGVLPRHGEFRNGRYGDSGDFDCNNFGVTFDSNDLIDFDGYEPDLPGLCNFDNATITFSPIDSSDTEYKDCAKNFAGPVVSPIPGTPYLYWWTDGPWAYSIPNVCKYTYFLDQLGNDSGFESPYGTRGVYYAPSELDITINGVVSIDQDIPDSELTINSCRFCPSGTYNLTDYIPYYSRSHLHGYKLTDDGCCVCTNMPKSTCINEIVTFFYYEENGIDISPYVQVDLKGYPSDDNDIVARFKKTIGTFDSTTQDILGLDCNGLEINGLTYDDSVGIPVANDDTPASGVNIAQRCDFSNAVIDVKLKSYDNLDTPCHQTEPVACNVCYDPFTLRTYSVTIPENWVWHGPAFCEYDHAICPDDVDLEGYDEFQPIAGGFILSPGSASWRMFTSGMACIWGYSDYQGELDYCPNGNINTFIQMQIKTDREIDWDLDPRNILGFYVELKFGYEWLLPSCAWSDVICASYISNSPDLIVTYISDFIPKANSPGIRNDYTGYNFIREYFDCSILNGLTFSSYSSTNCPGTSNPYYGDELENCWGQEGCNAWTWGGGNITINEV